VVSPLELDGSHGEGGGQILRTALALAVARRRAVRLTRIRALRRRPGLQPQHLAVVRALAAVSGAEVSGDALGSTELTFVPHDLRSGDYRFDVGAVRGSAGSVTLLFQALLLPLALAGTPSRLTLVGGTHVPWSPSVPYISDVFLPALEAAGVRARVALRRPGWYPAGRGEIEAVVDPVLAARGLTLDTPPAVSTATGVSLVSRLPASIAERQRRRALERLAAAGVDATIEVEVDDQAASPGTALFVAVRGRAGFTALGRRGLRAEAVAEAAVDAFLAWRASGAAIDEHLADQLVPFLAVASPPSRLTCPGLTSHLRTVAWVAEEFLPVHVRLSEGSPPAMEIDSRQDHASPGLPSAGGTSTSQLSRRRPTLGVRFRAEFLEIQGIRELVDRVPWHSRCTVSRGDGHTPALSYA
jgi:RNA 3'-terminal phosphate cyclase (ATP)